MADVDGRLSRLILPLITYTMSIPQLMRLHALSMEHLRFEARKANGRPGTEELFRRTV